MKKLLLTLFVGIFSIAVNAQDTFDKQMQESISKFEVAKTLAELDPLFEQFSQLSKSPSEKKWQAYYYAGFVMYKEAELLLASGDKNAAAEKNALAYKYTSAAEGHQPSKGNIKELLVKINDQKQKVN